MEVALESNGFFMGIEYLATFCCGMVGGLAAVRKGYDVFAILVTTWLTALGGGIIRDVLLGALPPALQPARPTQATARKKALLIIVPQARAWTAPIEAMRSSGERASSLSSIVAQTFEASRPIP